MLKISRISSVYKTLEVLLDRGRLIAAPESFIFAELSTREFQIYSKETDFKGGAGQIVSILRSRKETTNP
jgi:hypothetical protein